MKNNNKPIQSQSQIFSQKKFFFILIFYNVTSISQSIYARAVYY